MAVKTHRGVPYHLWNPFTDMDKFLSTLGIGPSVIVRGEGPYIFDERGKRYISGMAGLWNVAIGYGREELAEAAAKQMRELAYASCFRQVHPRAIELAAKLVEITGGHYQHVYLGTNGSEVTDAAIKMARQYHKQSPHPADRIRHKIISLRGCYHGVGFGAFSASGLERDAAKFGPLLPGFVQIDPAYCYRCSYGKGTSSECGLECVQALEKTIEAEGPETVAAFILEPIMGVLGMIDPPEEFYGRVGEICRRYGVLLIADEVTTGFGRTGKLFASQDWNPRPDILCLGKAISSGYLPLAATLATEAIYERFRGTDKQLEDGCTASGHPVCAAVGLANIDIMVREKLPENAARVGAYLKHGLQKLADKHERIGNVRGRGLMLALEFVEDRAQKTPLDAKAAEEIFMDTLMLGLVPFPHEATLGFMPPLIIKEDVADEIVDIVDKALETGLAANMARKARLVKAFAAAKMASS